ncbi:hypothetical protein SSX86_022323 [Deinandra increscens subsp. villosa]|uniref:Uncharacterized protein n=1 Tax=Deinandra increscens subsp. villosa TaxID=3103831 RepID=A0AAP0CP14_9ASTR
MSIVPSLFGGRRSSSVFDPFSSSLDIWDPFRDFPISSSSDVSRETSALVPDFSRNSKFFFPELSFCFGSTVMTPETEVIRSDVSTTRRRRRNGGFSKHWRPELSAIAEDGGALSACQRRSRNSDIIVRSEKKPLNKARSEFRWFSVMPLLAPLAVGFNCCVNWH